MKSTLFRFFTITGLLLLLTPSDSASIQNRRIALVIGNGEYKSSPLKNPVNDANDMAAALNKLGFTVRLKINANQRSMERSIRDFGKELRSGGVGLFYFAGHGIQVHGRNYLIPIGAEIESEADVKYESVDAGRVLSQMNEAENGLNIIILDACRDNPYARSFRSSVKGLAKMDAPTGSILAYATAPGSVAVDGTGRNGLYTAMLLKHMMEPNLVIERVFKKVRVDVMNESSMKQVPWELSSLTGDFYFISKKEIAVNKSPTVDFEKPNKEIEEEINNLKDKKKREKKLNEKKVESKELAYIPKSSTPLQPSSPFSVAIFPAELHSFSYGYNIIHELKKFFANNSLYYPKYSYYELKPYFDINLLDNKIFPPDVMKNLLTRKSIFGRYKPNVNLISKLGKELQVDLVYFFYLSSVTTGADDGPGSLEISLINVKTKKIYYANKLIEDDSVSDIFGEAKELTKKVFNDFEKDLALK